MTRSPDAPEFTAAALEDLGLGLAALRQRSPVLFARFLLEIAAELLEHRRPPPIGRPPLTELWDGSRRATDEVLEEHATQTERIRKAREKLRRVGLWRSGGSLSDAQAALREDGLEDLAPLLSRALAASPPRPNAPQLAVTIVMGCPIEASPAAVERLRVARRYRQRKTARPA